MTMKTVTVEQALEMGITAAAKCADCGAEGYETATPDGDVQDAELRTLAMTGNPEVLCASKHGGALVCDDCEEKRDAAKAQ
jgi:hypothetical protein